MSRKRLAPSASNPDAADSAFWNKRVMAGSTFDVHRAEPSQRQFMVTPPLDMHRAESSRHHVRALNTQFASWVQTQLKNHPDELWEDGVRDYLSHASSIMEKFSDVVNWLKANSLKGENSSTAGPQIAEKKLISEDKLANSPLDKVNSNPTSTTASSSPWSLGPSSSSQVSTGLFNSEMRPVPEIEGSKIKPSQEKPLFTPSSNDTSFVNPWSSGGFPSSQMPVFSGFQSSAPANVDASDDKENEDELEQPSSPSVKKSEERGVTVVHEVKCKLYVKSTDTADKDAWKDKGAGQLSIKCKEGVSKGTKESKPTIVVRNDVGKVLLNALIYPGIKTNSQKNSIVAIFHTVDDGGSNEKVVARTFLIRTKTQEDRNKLATAIQEYAPTS
ncbi:RanBD1 domain-containing protein [Psidium guajava]|nr:RanBD1 domain-containing protein [Psidium guajava]